MRKSILVKLWEKSSRRIVSEVCFSRLNSKQLLIIKGLADFHQSTTHQPFFSKFRDTVLTGDGM
jgi:hypothetical protein